MLGVASGHSRFCGYLTATAPPRQWRFHDKA
jgi:hypothetical protein